MEKGEFEGELQEYLSLKSKATRAVYASAFRHFLEYYKSKYGKDKGVGDFLDRIFAEFRKPPREQRRIAEIELKGFVDFLRDKGKSNNTIRLYFGAVQDFLKFKHITVSARYVGLPPAVEKKENHKHEWTLEQIKQFVKAAPSYREKAIILCLFQSGLSVNDLCRLNYGDIQEEFEKGIIPICLRLVRQKTNVEFKTFFGRDAVKYLRLYLQTRGILKPDSPLFVKERKRGGDVRITPGAIQQSFSEIAKQLPFIKNNGGFNPARPHSLRAAFRSQLTNKVSDSLIEFWMGHAIGAVARAYLNMPTDEMRELYMDAEKFLAIEKTSREEIEENKRRKSAEISEDLKKRIKDLEATVRGLTATNVQLQKELEGLKRRWDHFSKYLDLKPEELEALSEMIRRFLEQKNRQRFREQEQKDREWLEEHPEKLSRQKARKSHGIFFG